MSEATSIEWADSTFNCWLGCTKVSPACDHCYAEALVDKRLHKAKWGPGQPRVRTSVTNWRKPVQWNKFTFIKCLDCGWRGDKFVRQTVERHPQCQIYRCPTCNSMHTEFARRRVFCASLADVFDNEVPVAWRIELFDLIRSTPNLDWLLLTKRIGNAEKMIDEAGGWAGIGGGHGLRNPLPNVWIGATICNQVEADRDIPKLLATPAAVRFLSIEPMLGAIDLKFLQYEDSEERDELGRIIANTRRRLLKWVIAGGESGPHVRPSHPDWFRSLRDQCAAAGVPFLFKQWGEWAPYGRGRSDSTLLVEPAALDDPMQRFGKKACGRLLDGVEHSGFPEVREWP